MRVAFLGAGGNPVLPLSMGSRLAGKTENGLRGNALTPSCWRQQHTASNGAPPFNRRNRVRAYRGGACRTASIWPRSFNRGNV